jgi:hypothetical protein
MRKSIKPSIVFAALGLVLLCGALPARAQSTDSKEPPTPSNKPDAKRKESQPPLIDATRVSTDATVKAAAQDALSKKGGSQSSTSTIAPDPVLEFHPASAAADAKDDSLVLKQDDSKKSPLKDVHGEVHGESGSGAVQSSRVGASAGTKTKDGKTYIFLQTDQTKTNPSTPH